MLTDFCKPTIGGIEQHVFALSKKLIENGHQVVIGTLKQNRMKPFEAYNKVYIYRLASLFQKIPFIHSNPAKKYHPPLKDVWLTRELEKLVRDFQPDIIHCHGWITFSYLPLRSKINTPIINTLHHYGFLCPKQDLFFREETTCEYPLTSTCYHCYAKRYGLPKSIFAVNFVKMNKKNLLKVDKFIAVSNFVKNVYVKYLKLPDDKISVIPNFYGVETKEESSYEDLPSEFILYVGQLAPHKGVDFLLKAYDLSEVNLSLILLGSKHCAYDYRKFDDGEKIIVKENASRSLVLSAFKRCRFVVVPSIWPEPCPTVIMEAMGQGKAVIASKSGGIPEIVKHEETGFLLDLKNIQEFVTYLRLFTDNPSLCEKMGNRGKTRFLKCFSAEKVVRDVEDMYYKTLNG